MFTLGLRPTEVRGKATKEHAEMKNSAF